MTGPPESAAAPRADSTLGVHASVFLAMFLISFSYPVGEAIANEIDTGVLLLLRFLLAMAIFGPLVAWRHGIVWPGWRALAGYATISASLVLFFWCMFAGLRTTSALNTGAISTLIPGFTAIGGAILVGERLGRHRLAALVIGLVGALWVVFRGDWDRFIRLDLNTGDLIVFAGCVAMGFYSPLVKRLHRGEPVMVMTFWIMTMNAAWFLLIANSALWTMAWTDVPALAYGGVAYIAIGSTVISFFLIQSGTIKIGPTRVQSYSYLLPTFVLLIDWAFGKGLPTAMTIPGILIVLVASLVIQRGVIFEGRSAGTARP
jgi:drug/metabolite transporter (DMT)-like permease